MSNLRDEPVFNPFPGPLWNHEESRAGDWVRQYVLDELPEPDRTLFEEHFFDCPDCSDRVRTAYLLVRGAEVTLQRDLIRPGSRLEAGVKSPRPGAALPVRRARFAPLAVAAGAILAVLSGYQNVRLIPALRLQAGLADAPQSSPILPLSETRSEMDVIKSKGGYASLILSNVGGGTSSTYDCELRDQTGKLVWNFSVPAVPGDEWELRLPVRNLPPDRYTLRVRGAEDANNLSDSSGPEYHFVLEK